jgi:hypothetical protein
VEQTKSILIEQLQNSIGQTKWLSNDDMDTLVKDIRSAEMGTFLSYIRGLPSLVVGNMVFGLIVARFLRVKQSQDWLNDSEVA